MKLNPIQNLVAKYYCGGEFEFAEDTDEVSDCGDSLFVFAINEAGDCLSPGEYSKRLQTAVSELLSMRAEIELKEPS